MPQNPPSHFPRITPYLLYRDVPTALLYRDVPAALE
jgi:hypothetical protein